MMVSTKSLLKFQKTKRTKIPSEDFVLFVFYQITMPPFGLMTCPVMKAASSDAR